MNNKVISRKAQAYGDRFEQMIIMANARYASKGKGLISKIPTATKPVKAGGVVRWIPDKKTGCDFIGVYKGVPVAIETKSTANKTNFPLYTHGKQMIAEHQIRFLQKFEQCGGKAFILIQIRGTDMVCLLEIGIYTRLAENARKAGKKSISVKELEEYEVSARDYLGGI